MISYVVPLWRDECYREFCRPALERQVAEYGAEIIETRSETSIFKALEAGRQQASFDTIVYLHDDVELLDNDTTERVLMTMATHELGLLGVCGSAAGEMKCPWWTADRVVGAWVRKDRRGNRIWEDVRYRRAAHPRPSWTGQRGAGEVQGAQLLDGIFMADRTGIPWPDEAGWHGYDLDRSMRARAAGFEVAVGDILVCHHHGGKPIEVAEEWTQALGPAMTQARESWGLG